MALIFYSFSFWAPTMMIRAYNISLSQAGFILGLITIISSIAGTIFAGSAVDYLRNKNYSDAPVRAALFAVLLALPPIIILSFVNTEIGAWTCIFLYLFFISLINGLKKLGFISKYLFFLIEKYFFLN